MKEENNVYESTTTAAVVEPGSFESIRAYNSKVLREGLINHVTPGFSVMAFMLNVRGNNGPSGLFQGVKIPLSLDDIKELISEEDDLEVLFSPYDESDLDANTEPFELNTEAIDASARISTSRGELIQFVERMFSEGRVSKQHITPFLLNSYAMQRLNYMVVARGQHPEAGPGFMSLPTKPEMSLNAEQLHLLIRDSAQAFVDFFGAHTDEPMIADLHKFCTDNFDMITEGCKSEEQAAQLSSDLSVVFSSEHAKEFMESIAPEIVKVSDSLARPASKFSADK